MIEPGIDGLYSEANAWSCQIGNAEVFLLHRLLKQGVQADLQAPQTCSACLEDNPEEDTNNLRRVGGLPAILRYPGDSVAMLVKRCSNKAMSPYHTVPHRRAANNLTKCLPTRLKSMGLLGDHPSGRKCWSTAQISTLKSQTPRPKISKHGDPH